MGNLRLGIRSQLFFSSPGGYPVLAVLGKQGKPFVPALLVEVNGLANDEIAADLEEIIGHFRESKASGPRRRPA